MPEETELLRLAGDLIVSAPPGLSLTPFDTLEFGDGVFADRAAFDAWTDRLFALAEILWPSAAGPAEAGADLDLGEVMRRARERDVAMAQKPPLWTPPDEREGYGQGEPEAEAETREGAPEGGAVDAPEWSERQRGIIARLRAGDAPKDIAAALGLSGPSYIYQLRRRAEEAGEL